VDELKIGQLIVIDIDAKAEKESCVPLVNDLVATELHGFLLFVFM
jgi:hypothetical protein